MHLARMVIVGLLLGAVSACASPATAGTSPSPAPSASNAFADPVIDSSGLVSLTSAETCALLSPAEATIALGSPLIGPPHGSAIPGIDAQCTYGAATAIIPGTYIKVDLSAMGFSGEAILVNLHRGTHTLRVGGFEAIGADAETDPAIENAVLSIKLAKTTSDPALWIEAPSSKIAEQVALLILPRLAAHP